MRLAAKIIQIGFIWLSMGLALTACSLFGGDRPKPVERPEFEDLSARVVHLEDLVLKSPLSPWATPSPAAGLAVGPDLAPGSPPLAAAAPQVAAMPSRSQDWARYQRALSQVRSRRYAEAAATFVAMLAENPQGSLAPNARYWLGECHYARGDFSSALAEFQRGFQDYPASGKAPDYLLKMSYCQSRLGDGHGAMESMRVLLERYPNSNSANLVKSGRSRF
jgi:tol-pal system protein YbgF